MVPLRVGFAVVCLSGSSALAYNADPGPGKNDFGSHAAVSRITVEYLRETFTGDGREARAAAWIARFGRGGVAAVLRDKTADSAFLRGANGPDRLDTAVDVPEVELCFPGHDLRYRIRIPGASVTILGKKIQIWKGAEISVALSPILRRLAGLAPDKTAKALLLLIGQDKCTSAVAMPGGQVPMRAAGLNHFMKAGRPVGYRMTADSSIFALLPEAVSGEVVQKITGYVQKVIPWSLVRRVLSDASKWVDAKIRAAAEAVLRPLTAWIVDKILNRLITVKRIRFSFDGRTPIQRRQPRLPIGKVQFDNASDRADWWYEKARRYVRSGKEIEAVLALGHTAHFLQDNALPHHNWGFLMRGHGAYEDAAHRYIADELASARFHQGKRFRLRVATSLGRLREAGRDSPGRLIRERLWPIVRARYPDLPSKSVEDPESPEAGDPEGFRRGQIDLAHAVAATAWLVLKFHAEVVAPRR